MSASDQKSAIVLSDTPGEVKSKINKLAFSGGNETAEEHRRSGGNTDIDVAYQYLRYFLDNDSELKRYKDGYESGIIMSGEMKAKCIEVVQGFLKDYQKSRDN